MKNIDLILGIRGIRFDWFFRILTLGGLVKGGVGPLKRGVK